MTPPRRDAGIDVLEAFTESKSDARRTKTSSWSAYAAVAFISEQLDRAILRQYPDIGRHRRPACSLVVYSSPSREVWSFGEGSWAHDGAQHRGGKKIDDVTASVRAAVTEAHLADAWTLDEVADKDPGRAAIQGPLNLQGMFANRMHPLGYGTVNGGRRCRTAWWSWSR